MYLLLKKPVCYVLAKRYFDKSSLQQVAQVSEPPAAPKAMSVPPPPPPEPPKMEIKGEPAAKPVKPIPKEEPKAAAKEPESSKGVSARDTLGRFFRKKVIKQEMGVQDNSFILRDIFLKTVNNCMFHDVSCDTYHM